MRISQYWTGHLVNYGSECCVSNCPLRGGSGERKENDGAREMTASGSNKGVWGRNGSGGNKKEGGGTNKGGEARQVVEARRRAEQAANVGKKLPAE